jgi:hypothetical protein
MSEEGWVWGKSPQHRQNAKCHCHWDDSYWGRGGGRVSKRTCDLCKGAPPSPILLFKETRSAYFIL